MREVENRLDVNHEYTKLAVELESLGRLLKSVETTVRYRAENYKGSDLERNRVGVYRSVHPPYFEVFSKDLINKVIKEFKGNVYEVVGEKGVSLEVLQISYDETGARNFDGLQGEEQSKTGHTFNSLRLVLGVKEEDK